MQRMRNAARGREKCCGVPKNQRLMRHQRNFHHRHHRLRAAAVNALRVSILAIAAAATRAEMSGNVIIYARQAIYGARWRIS